MAVCVGVNVASSRFGGDERGEGGDSADDGFRLGRGVAGGGGGAGRAVASTVANMGATRGASAGDRLGTGARALGGAHRNVIVGVAAEARVAGVGVGIWRGRGKRGVVIAASNAVLRARRGGIRHSVRTECVRLQEPRKWTERWRRRRERGGRGRRRRRRGRRDGVFLGFWAVAPECHTEVGHRDGPVGIPLLASLECGGRRGGSTLPVLLERWTGRGATSSGLSRLLTTPRPGFGSLSSSSSSESSPAPPQARRMSAAQPWTPPTRPPSS